MTSKPEFTGADYQLIADSVYREEDRRELFQRYHGIPAPADDHLDRLADFLVRLGRHLADNDVSGFHRDRAT